MREVLDARRRNDAAATLAFDVCVHRLARELAGMTAAIGGVDVVAFTGGVGEGASVTTLVVQAREDLEIAAQTRAALRR